MTHRFIELLRSKGDLHVRNSASLIRDSEWGLTKVREPLTHKRMRKESEAIIAQRGARGRANPWSDPFENRE